MENMFKSRCARSFQQGVAKILSQPGRLDNKGEKSFLRGTRTPAEGGPPLDTHAAGFIPDLATALGVPAGISKF